MSNHDWGNDEYQTNLVEIAWLCGMYGFNPRGNGGERELFQDWAEEFEAQWIEAGENPSEHNPYCFLVREAQRGVPGGDVYMRMDFTEFAETFVKAKIAEHRMERS